MAVREGFEPSIRFRVYTLSRRAPSATRTPHRFSLRTHQCNGALLYGVRRNGSRTISLFFIIWLSNVRFAGKRNGTCSGEGSGKQKNAAIHHKKPGVSQAHHAVKNAQTPPAFRQRYDVQFLRCPARRSRPARPASSAAQSPPGGGGVPFAPAASPRW